MSESLSGRIDIIAQGEFHFEARYFENEKQERYRFEAAWLERSFPGVVVAPLIYDVKDGSLCQFVRSQ